MDQAEQELNLLCCTDMVWQQDVVSWPSTHLLCDLDSISLSLGLPFSERER